VKVPLRKIFLLILIPVLLILAVLPAVFLGGRSWILHELSATRNIGSVSITPFGFRFISPLNWGYDSLQIRSPNLQADIHTIRLHINLAAPGNSFGENLLLTADSLNMRISSDSTSEKEPLDSLVFPELSIPVRTGLKLRKADVSRDSMFWSGSGLRLHNSSSHSLEAILGTVQGHFLPEPISLGAKLNWVENHAADLEASVLAANGDSLEIYAEAPLTDLGNLLGETKIYSQNPLKWVPGKIPKQVPDISDAAVQGSFGANVLQKSWNYNLKLNLTTGRFNKLVPGFRHDLKITGTELRPRIDWTLQGAREEYLRIQGSGDIQKKSFDLQAVSRNYRLPLAKRSMPADAQFHYIRGTWPALEASFTTAQGSDFVLNAKFEPELSAEVVAHVVAGEPWAERWIEPNLRLGPHTNIEGSYRRGLFLATVRTSAPFAFRAEADSLQTDMQLSRTGIFFDQAWILNKGERFPLEGEVRWGGEHPHVKFDVERENGGNITFYADLVEKNLSLNISEFPLQAAPVADTSIKKQLQGTATGNWSYAWENKQGKAALLWQTTFAEKAVDLQVQLEQNRDSLNITRFSASHFGSSLEGSALIDLSVAEGPAWNKVIQGNLTIPSLELPPFSNAFLDSMFTSGKLNGRVYYNKEQGLDGSFAADNLVLRLVDSNFFRLPRLRIDGNLDKVQLTGRMKLGKLGEWDSEVALNADKLFSEQKVFSGAAATDRGGVLWFEGDITDSSRASGKLEISGPWLMPGGAAELSSTGIRGAFDFDPRQAVESMNGWIESDSLRILLSENLNAMPASINVDIKQGLLNTNGTHISNELGDLLQLELQMDLGQKKIENLSFNSELFRLRTAENQLLTLKNFRGRSEISDSLLKIEAELPDVSFLQENTGSGSLRLKASSELVWSKNTAMPAGLAPPANLGGQIYVDQFLYKNNFNVDDPTRLVDAIGNLIRNIRGRESQRDRSVTAKSSAVAGEQPMTLNISLRESDNGSMRIETDVLNLPLTTQMRIRGNIKTPLLSGEVNTTGEGYMGINQAFRFDVDNANLSWNNQRVPEGKIEVNSSTSLPLCSAEEGDEECPVQLELSGEITNPQLQPMANCGWEATPRDIYQGVLLGCLAEPLDQNTNVSQTLERAGSMMVSNLFSKLGNSLVGSDVIGKTQMRVDWLGSSALEESDSNFIRVPIKLDKLVKNLQFTAGYTEGTGINPRYDKSFEAGLDYTIPLFDDSTRNENPNMLDPKFSVTTKLISKTYNVEAESDADAWHIESYLGFLYQYRFWNDCFLGMGNCPEQETSDTIQSSREEPSGEEP